jgi:hypothetical protein
MPVENEAGKSGRDRDASFMKVHASIEPPLDLNGMWEARPDGISQ